MKKISVFSYYVSGNIGDVLIAQEVQKLFASRVSCVFANMDGRPVNAPILITDDISNSAGDTSWKQRLLNTKYIGDVVRFANVAVSARSSQCLERCSGSSWAVFAGGNQIMELGILPSNMLMVYRTICGIKRRGIRVAFCFCGVGPLARSWDRFFAKKVIDMADFISVRDNQSYDLVKQLSADKHVEIWRDPVLIMENPCQENVEGDRIGVNVFYGTDRSLEKDAGIAYVKLVSELQRRFPGKKIVLFSSTMSDYAHVSNCYYRLSDNTNVEIAEVASAEELMALLEKLCIIVGARMHTLIVSSVLGKPTVAISWQEKVESLMDYLQGTQRCVQLGEFIKQPEKTAELIMETLIQSEEVTAKTTRSIQLAKAETMKRIEAFVGEINNG